MAKRVKKGFRMELRDGRGLVVAQEHDGKLRMTESSASAYDAVDLTAAMCEQAGILDALEDAPSPGRRLYEARQAEASKGHRWSGWDLLSDEERDYHERVAARLGIKEGES